MLPTLPFGLVYTDGVTRWHKVELFAFQVQAIAEFKRARASRDREALTRAASRVRRVLRSPSERSALSGEVGRLRAF